MAYAMLDSISGKYVVSDKKDFTSGGLMYLEDAQLFYNKIKIVKTDIKIIEQFKEACILKVNSNLKDFKSKI